MSSFFGAYDLRGVYPDEIAPEEALTVGRAFGTYVDAADVIVGRDGRSHADRVTGAFVDGVLSTGTGVVDVGRVPTPLVRFASRTVDAGAAAMVTASHNPPEYTGFKFTKAGGVAMSREGGMAEIQRCYESEAFASGTGTVTRRDLLPAYLDYLSERVGGATDVTVVANFGNGVASVGGRQLLERLGCTVVGVNETVDGEFPDHPPVPDDPTAVARIQERMDGADLGVVFDGDGDRAGFVVPGVGQVSVDKVLALFARECLAERSGTVAYSLNASQLLPDVVTEEGGTPHETRVGFTFLSEYIHEHPDVVFAGEPSGHFAFPAFGVPWDDGLFAAAFMSHLVAETDVAERIAAFPDYPVSPMLRIDCPHEQKAAAVRDVVDAYAEHEQSTVDGVKIVFDDGWALVRPSNTEPKLSVRCEADTEAALDRIRTDVVDTVEGILEGAAGSQPPGQQATDRPQ